MTPIQTASRISDLRLPHLFPLLSTHMSFFSEDKISKTTLQQLRNDTACSWEPQNCVSCPWDRYRDSKIADVCFWGSSRRSALYHMASHVMSSGMCIPAQLLLNWLFRSSARNFRHLIWLAWILQMFGLTLKFGTFFRLPGPHCTIGKRVISDYVWNLKIVRAHLGNGKFLVRRSQKTERKRENPPLECVLILFT